MITQKQTAEVAPKNAIEVRYNPLMGGAYSFREHRNLFVCNNLELTGTYYEAVEFFQETFPSKIIIFKSSTQR